MVPTGKGKEKFYLQTMLLGNCSEAEDPGEDSENGPDMQCC